VTDPNDEILAGVASDGDVETVTAELVVADAELAAVDRWRRPRHDRSAVHEERPLSAAAQRLVMEGIPPKTRETYNRAWGYYRNWGAEKFGEERVEEELLPSLESTMIEYITGLERLPVHNRCENGRQADGAVCTGHRPAPSTLWVWYSAVRMAHSIADPPYPWYGGKRLALAMNHYCEEMADKLGWQPKAAPRCWPEHLTAMVDLLDLDDEAAVQDRAQLLVGWYTGARASDLATYRIADVAFTPLGVDLTLRNSKTNKRVGRKVERRVLRPAFNADGTPSRYCAVVALDAWVNGVLRNKYRITQGALFRPYTKPSKSGSRCLLRGPRDELGFKMAGVSISDRVKSLAVAAGVPDAQWFSQHSLRRGRATHLRMLKVDQLAIARSLGWKNLPPATYMDEADAFDVTAPANVGLLV
jgi:hypothetical protein